MDWKPVPGHIMTRWAKEVTPENAWREYPRPQMRRKQWLNLNGLWNFEVKPNEYHRAEGKNGEDLFNDSLHPSRLRGEILVPFPIESALSGVKHPLQSDELLKYRRMFSIPSDWNGKRILLHFGAVDWETKVFVNGHLVGEHVGGYLSFWFDITDVLVKGENELIVSVWDPTDSHWQQRGKQVLKPKTIWYTAVSGIWQTVWLEPVPQTYISNMKITPDVDGRTVSVKVNLAGSQTGLDGVRVRVMDAGALMAVGETDYAETEIKITIPDPKLWSPDSPHYI